MEGVPTGYRPNVGVCLVNSKNQIFVASKLYMPGVWQMPQWAIEEGEEPLSAATRELQEETGVVSTEVIAEAPHWLTYDFPPSVKAKVNRLSKGEWHGHAQKWFLIRMISDDSEIKIASSEVDPEWKWASPKEVVDQAVDHKREMYEEVMRTFMPLFNATKRM
ncbi:Rna pyrophosphohydrolase [Thalictrum thalictroides]|uniref:Rna pyrophosphohydrolase n=1 Tax=Thalictrum thalictroides TaxID=46969 RepID=A0A7J6WCL2_THATH|nr:Rna pyrophosphohydrolase [Thalictrum thalictroides]